MASKMPPADAEQPKSLLAQYNKRLLRRLGAWGGAAAFSLVLAVIVSQTGAGNKRLQIALFGSEQPDESMLPLSAATAPMPPADFAAVNRATSLTAAKLAAMERNTAATRAETKQLAVQVSKLTADSFRVTGRLANIEQQIDGITGSIKQHAEEAAAAAVAKASPPKSEHDKAFEPPAPVIGAPATAPPQLSLIMPPTPPGASKSEHTAARDITSAIPTTPKAGSKDQSRLESKNEAKVASEAAPMAKEPSRPEEMMKAAVEPHPKAAPEAKGRPMPKPEPKARPAGAQMRMASASAPRRRVTGPYWLPRRGYGVDLGGADSVTVVNAQWAAVKANFGPMLVGMRPTAVRDHQLLGGGKFRLVVSHMRTLKAAERLCARFARQQVSCQPVEFDDGRVVSR